MKHFIIISLALLIFASCNTNSKNESITVFCAAGMTDIVNELVDSFKVKNPAEVKLNLASSGTLARQIAMGNPADIYISASKRWADYTDSLEAFSERKLLWQNQLVMVAPKTDATDSIEFSSPEAPIIDGYLSMGDPDHVPAGKYALDALTMLGWWGYYEDKILPAKDVRSALMMVEMGECPLGIVYYTDALASEKVTVVGEFPDSCHKPIIMHALLSEGASETATAFYTLLNDTTYATVWMKYGLTTAKN